MATEVFVNIKDLPEITEMNNGEYILVETPTGTHIIDFKNFVLPIDNTIITTTVSSHATAIANLNTQFGALSTNTSISLSNLSATHDNDVAKLTTKFDTLSTKVDLLNPLYIGKCTITIKMDSKEGSANLTPSTLRPSTLTIDDVMVFPANEYASKNPVYVSEYSDGLVKIKGSFPTKTISFAESTANEILGTSTFHQLSSKSVNQFLSTLSYKETNGNATEDAIYNVLVVKAI